MNDEWGTKRTLFNKLDREFNFTLDVSATAENAKCQRFFTKDDDGLSKTWRGVVWMNPPFSEIGIWLKKAVESKCTVVSLVPTRTNPPWWNDFILKYADEIRYIRKKLSFEGVKKGVAFTGHAIIVFRERAGNPKSVSYDQ